MTKYLSMMYPFWACVLSIVLAQVVKPFLYYIKHKKWDWRTIYASGGFPSSHSSGVAALCLATGIQERFDSTIFAVALAFSIIVIYDAANVRYYTGQNIQITQQLIKDLQDNTDLKLDDPIYLSKIKEVIGHKWIEVIGGVILGVAIAILLFFIGA